MSKNYYELTYILNPVLEDEQYDEIVNRYEKFIGDHDGELDETDRWGNRKFEHEMDGRTSGYYVNCYFRAPGELIADLERTLRLDDEVLRYLTLKYDAKMMRHRELQRKGAVPSILDLQEETEEGEDDDE
ncbi:MAG: 30S ribosomal protein S6 [Balneolaceae bacterium]|nr:30S ribosomal protein S6 [Balneolaceae bacterium]